MDQKFVKRNYTYLIYSILKKESEKNGKHFTAEDLIKIISERYGVVPNRKTIYTVIDDLIALGFDVKTKKDGQNRGYFLDKRIVKRGDFALILDGVCSLNDLDIDYKQEIIDDLCDAVGYDYLKLDLYEYDSRNLSIDSDSETEVNQLNSNQTKVLKFKLLFNIIVEAISTNKKIQINSFVYRNLDDYLLDIPKNEFKSMMKANSTGCFLVSPFQIFRNRENQLCLIYFIKYRAETFVFATPIVDFKDLLITNERREKTDTKVRSINLDNLTNAREYRDLLLDNTTQYHIDFQITYGFHRDSELFQIITSYLEGFIYIINNGVKYIHGYYLAKNEPILEEIAIQNSKYLTIFPGCRIWDYLNNLSTTLQKYNEVNKFDRINHEQLKGVK